MKYLPLLLLAACSGTSPYPIDYTILIVDAGPDVSAPDAPRGVPFDGAAPPESSTPEAQPVDAGVEASTPEAGCVPPEPISGARPGACGVGSDTQRSNLVPTFFAWENDKAVACGWAPTPSACLCDYSCACLKAHDPCPSISSAYAWVGCNDQATTAVGVYCQ